MKNIAIYGAGGFGKETKLLLDLINRSGNWFDFKGFLDDDPKSGSPKADQGAFQALAIAIASPAIRRRVRNSISAGYEYPNLISPDVFLDSSLHLGVGNIFCSGVKLTVEITIADFVIINLNAIVGHDVTIGAFSSIMPSVSISGNVSIGEEVFVGTGAVILQGLKIGDRAVIGAGAVVTKNIPPGAVVKGVPGRW